MTWDFLNFLALTIIFIAIGYAVGNVVRHLRNGRENRHD